MLEEVGPLEPENPLVGSICPGCLKPFAAGQTFAEIKIGPGESAADRAACREMRGFNCLVILVHWACATGIER